MLATIPEFGLTNLLHKGVTKINKKISTIDFLHSHAGKYACDSLVTESKGSSPIIPKPTTAQNPGTLSSLHPPPILITYFAKIPWNIILKFILGFK
jgi:hypothetical protein